MWSMAIREKTTRRLGQFSCKDDRGQSRYGTALRLEWLYCWILRMAINPFGCEPRANDISLPATRQTTEFTIPVALEVEGFSRLVGYIGCPSSFARARNQHRTSLWVWCTDRDSNPIPLHGIWFMVAIYNQGYIHRIIERHPLQSLRQNV